MQPVNLYTLTRVDEPSEFTVYEKHLSHRRYKVQQREREIGSLTVLVDMLLDAKTDIYCLDSFYYGYVIPQLGKEFDLLKFTDKAIINVELKSADVGEERRIKQLRCNRHYLKHTGYPVISFVFVSDTRELYEYTDNILVRQDMSRLVSVLKTYCTPAEISVNELFKVSNFLVSPLNTPEKFLKGEYFLTQQQESFKESIISTIENSPQPQFFYIEGSAGTGKTLLFYDLAENLSQTDRCCLIHCGTLTSGHHIIAEGLERLDIISMTDASKGADLSGYRYIFIDGAHRIYRELLDKTVSYINETGKTCFFSFDRKQVLSRNETAAEITDRIKEISGIHGMCLKNKIRTNKMMQSFIRSLFCLKRRNSDICRNVSILYASDNSEAQELISLYIKKDYVFVNYTHSGSVKSRIDLFRKYQYCSTHDVIGQEFDNIIMYMDENFYYDSQGFLRSKTHPHKNYIYTNLLFQGVTRVREKLCLIIIGNRPLFHTLLDLVSEDENQ